MGTVDVKNGQRFERRIGRRIEVDPIDVTFFMPQTGRFRKKAPPHEVPARIENVSITGAAIVGPSSLPWQPGDRVVVRSRGADNVVVVRHRQATGAGDRFGVELTRSAATLKRQIQLLLDPHLAVPAVDEEPAGPMLGLRRAEAPRLGGLPLVHPPTPQPDGEAAAAALPHYPPPPPPPPAPAQVSEPGPVLDLSGPEPVLDLTDSVMARSEPEPATPTASESEVTDVADVADVADVTDVTPAEPGGEGASDAGARRVVAPRAPSPHLPRSEGRQVLDDVFGLMSD